MKFFFSFLVTTVFVLGTVSTPSVYAAGVGDLVKCPDFSSVYYLAADGNRYAFPTESVYASWYPDFTNVKTISCSDLASLRLAGLVPYQAGTRLVKTPSVPTVYVVEPDGVLRPLQDEVQATRIYGTDWSKRVDDLSETFLSSYSIEEAFVDTLPVGLPVMDTNQHYFLVQADGSAVQIDALLAEGEGGQLKPSALALADVEARLGQVISIVMTDISSDKTLLEDISETLHPIFVSPEDAVSSDAIDFSEQAGVSSGTSSGDTSSTDSSNTAQDTSDLELIVNEVQNTSSELDALESEAVSLE